MQRSRVDVVVRTLVLSGCVALIGWLVTTGAASATSDGAYVLGAPGADNAAPPIDALVHGHLGQLPGVQTVMGMISILWRAPFVAAANELGAGARLEYAVGAAACLLPLAALVAWIIGRTPGRRQTAVATVAGFVMIVGFSTLTAVQDGHPETLLLAALGVAAVLAARADRRLTAAVLLGLAIGTKETGLIAMPAVLLALGGGRRRAAAIALAIAATTTVPLVLLDPGAFLRADASIGPITTVAPMSLWWAVAPGQLPFGLERPEAAGAGLVLIAVIAWLVSLSLRWRRPRIVVPPIDPLALLALSGLLRCILDPANLAYYLVAMFVPLVTWEAGIRRRWPIVSVCFWGVEALCYGGTVLTRPLVTSDAAVGIDLFLCAAMLLAGYLCVCSFRPRLAPFSFGLRPLALRVLGLLLDAPVAVASWRVAAPPVARTEGLSYAMPDRRARRTVQISARHTEIAQVR